MIKNAAIRRVNNVPALSSVLSHFLESPDRFENAYLTKKIPGANNDNISKG